MVFFYTLNCADLNTHGAGCITFSTADTAFVSFNSVTSDFIEKAIKRTINAEVSAEESFC